MEIQCKSTLKRILLLSALFAAAINREVPGQVISPERPAVDDLDGDPGSLWTEHTCGEADLRIKDYGSGDFDRDGKMSSGVAFLGSVSRCMEEELGTLVLGTSAAGRPP